MHIENLYLSNFKNYEEVNIDFSSTLNVLLGENGSGKTNILDAIYFLSLTKSAFNAIDNQSMRHGTAFYSIIGRFILDGQKYNVQNSLQTGKRKKLLINLNVVKAAEVVGQFPVVLIAPNDHQLIDEGGETRRRFFDSILSQLDPSYLAEIMEYSRALKSRNSLLRQFSETNRINHDLLDPYDKLLLRLGKRIESARARFCDKYLKQVSENYEFLTDGKENIALTYQSQFSEDDYESKYLNSLKKDLILQRTTCGIHRDDYIFSMNGYPIKKYGSQGQQKSFLIALKLAQFDTIKTSKGFKPIVLMDDIFDKLDDQRIKKLTEMITKKTFGQVFITDARAERTYHFLEKLDQEWLAIHVDCGTLHSKKIG